MRINLFFLSVISFICINCTEDEHENRTDIPEHIQQLDNITIYEADLPPAYEITLHRQVIFGDTEEVFLGASIRHIISDDKDRVFMADMRQNVVHVFASDGSYLASIGREGRGPGEFQWIAAVTLHNGDIHVMDSVQSKISIFDIDTFDHQKDLNIAISEGNHDSPSWIEWSRENMFYYTAIDFYTNRDGNYIIIFGDLTIGALDNIKGRTWETSLYNPEEEEYLKHDISSFKADMNPFIFDEGRISSVLFKPQAYRSGNHERMVYAWGEELLFHIYDTKSAFKHAFYYKRTNTELKLEELVEYYYEEFSDHEEFRDPIIRSLRSAQLPQTWPAIQALIMDDENRLWVSTIVENFDVYEWWVLEETGELLAKFEWPRSEPIEFVKDGYLYTKETISVTGLQQIVRYRIEIGEG